MARSLSKCNEMSIKAFLCYLATLIFVICLMAIYSNLSAFSRQTYLEWKEKPHIVLGILSRDTNTMLRDAMRSTWIATMLKMQEDLPFKTTYKFLIDSPTNETVKENAVNKDILFLNTTYQGRAVKFGLKLYVWFKYISNNYPNALLGAKIDDDVYLCIPQLLRKLDSLKSTKLYYGYAHIKGPKITRQTRCDEMFVVLGKDLIHRIAKRKYCGARVCKSKKELVDTNFGGTSIGAWLSIYNDVDFQPDNANILQYGGINRVAAMGAKHAKQDFCEKRLIFHKSNPEIMKKLNKLIFNNI